MNGGVYITFDVECSMGGAWRDDELKPVPPSRAVWGDYGDSRFGLPLITRILGRHGLAATFFVEAFMAEQGHDGGEEAICRFLLDRGHDVQLHVHPNHKHYGLHKAGLPFTWTDDIADLPGETQRELLVEGAERLKSYTGLVPVAFRAGNMAASEETLRQLAAMGIKIDSSYAFPFLGGQCKFADREQYNGSKWYGDVLEMALSGFRQVHLPGLHPAKPLDLVGISFEECRDAIQQITGAGADAVLILHSFSLFKVRNVQYDGGRLNRIVARRFRRLCRWLGERKNDLPVRTFGDLAGQVARGCYHPHAVSPCRLRRPVRAAVRKAVQAVNNCYWF